MFERDFTEKAKEKLDALDRTVDYCSDDTQPTKSQVLSVKKKWEEVQSSVNTQLEEFNVSRNKKINQRALACFVKLNFL